MHTTKHSPLYSPKNSYITSCTDIETNNSNLALRPIVGFYDKIFILLYSLAYTVIGAMFVYVLVSSLSVSNNSQLTSILAGLGFFALLTIESLRLFQGFTIPFFALRAKDPVYMTPEKGLRVALLTTIVPSKEPLEIVENTLQAMKKVRYDGVVDVWILDEGNDQRVKDMATRIGVRHFSRHGIDKYNQASGEFKAKTKAGNHNSWRAEHEDSYDIVAQMDPDHVPFENFLERILGYFRDPTVGFVVAPQVYGNQTESFIARAAAEQAYIFHGIIQRAGNSSHTPLLIGTNHAYRTEAWKQISGYQDSIIEDHLTSVALHCTNIEGTDTKWKGVYTPDIVSVGEGPTTWTDYFNQQKRWAYGVWEIVTRHNPKYFKNLSWSQKMHYVALQSFYPSIAVSWILSLIVCTVTLFFGFLFIDVDVWKFMTLWFGSVALQITFSVWIMRYNLNRHERKTTGASAMLLTLLVAPVYSAAAVTALLRRKLQYAVTAKGDLRTLDTWTTYSTHFVFLFSYLVLVAVAVYTLRHNFISFYWAIFTLVILLPLPTYFLVGKFYHSLPRITFMKNAVQGIRTFLF